MQQCSTPPRCARSTMSKFRRWTSATPNSNWPSKLIDQSASNTFDASVYKDEVFARVEAAVQKKVEGQEITLSEAVPATAQVID